MIELWLCKFFSLVILRFGFGINEMALIGTTLRCGSIVDFYFLFFYFSSSVTCDDDTFLGFDLGFCKSMDFKTLGHVYQISFMLFYNRTQTPVNCSYSRWVYIIYTFGYSPRFCDSALILYSTTPSRGNVSVHTSTLQIVSHTCQTTSR